MRQLLVSDSNIFIDLEYCQLTHKLFELPYHFCTPDLLFEFELKAQHAHLLESGLRTLTLSSQFVSDIKKLSKKYIKTSTYNLMSLLLAKQEECPLLTGDEALRDEASKEDIIVKGTIWILEQMVFHKILSKNEVLSALDTMKNSGRRLPFKKAKKLLESAKNH